MKNILITGVTGFVGFNYLKELEKNQSYKIWAIIKKKKDKNNLKNLFKNVIFIQIPLEKINFKNLNSIIPKIDICIHLAWSGVLGKYKNDNMQKKNLDLTLNLFYIVRDLGVKKFFFMSTVAEFGKFKGIINEQSPKNPITQYGITKKITNELLKDFCKNYKINYFCGLLCSPYGKNENSNVIISHTINNLRKRKEVLLSDCENYWEFLHIHDVIKSINKIVFTNHKLDGDFIISSGHSKKLKFFIKLLPEYLNYDGSLLKFGSIKRDKLDIINLRSDVSRLLSIGWEPLIKFKQGVNEYKDDK